MPCSTCFASWDDTTKFLGTQADTCPDSWHDSWREKNRPNLDTGPYEPHRSGTPGRFDVAGVEWWACDPYPTWYRYEGDTLIERGWNRDALPWADAKEREKADKLYLSLLGARERLCIAQMLVPQDYKAILENAIQAIDLCGSDLVPEVWSKNDNTHKGY
jgi:hypothetical protein